MAESQSPKATPKRKRHDIITAGRLSSSPTPSSNFPSHKNVFSFQAPVLQPVKQSNKLVEDGDSSPRSKVAQKFGDMALQSRGGGSESGGGVAPSELGHHRRLDASKFSPQLAVFDFDGGASSSTGREMQLDDDEDSVTRKRPKLPENESTHESLHTTASFALNGETSADAAGPVQIDDSGHLTLHGAVDPTIVSKSKNGGVGRLQKSYPSINRLSDSKSRSRKRAGTPPPASSKRRAAPGPPVEEEPDVVDPIRAALTWHEDEITVYDPDDKDDDGTGLNGIGFKPTTAIAFQRAQKRRQQLAEYKKREEGEARTRRNQRRREQLGGGAELERKHSMMRVHFSEAEPTRVITT
ncbi:Uu.00g144660.m01.CDS01 [Anthostomella pinea]|uniref:Uu.00g144660.m01.CDS01 n=1 Tax=Anthostomella pinea TaxID=933095 RepID=A0AAI8YLX2_9PEZI|nr:Uu.00g144660.m01.CDS01 [Anthostomella pinea]